MVCAVKGLLDHSWFTGQLQAVFLVVCNSVLLSLDAL